MGGLSELATPDGWELATVLSKWLMLMAMLSAPGVATVLLLLGKQRDEFAAAPALAGYQISTAVLGALAACAWFLAQLGAVNQRGLAGLFDPVMFEILLETSLGDVLRFRLPGFALAALGGLCLLLRRYRFCYLAFLPLSLVATLCFALSFSASGHTNSAPWWVQLAVMLHAGVLAVWLGALFPLWLACSRCGRNTLAALMTGFGTLGIALVAVLIASGLTLIVGLTDSWKDLPGTAWGQMVLIKLVGVAAVLALAARHKLLLVPQLARAEGKQQEQGSAGTLRISIAVEGGLATLVLLVTAVLSTLTSP